MSRFFTFVPLSLLAASGLVFAQSPASSAPAEDSGPSGSMRQESSGASGTSGSAASGSVPATEGNRALNSSVRGSAENASTSDRDTSRRWPGVGSTGGATGTGTSSGTTADPPASGGSGQGSSASGRPEEAGVSGGVNRSTDGLREPGGSR